MKRVLVPILLLYAINLHVAFSIEIKLAQIFLEPELPSEIPGRSLPNSVGFASIAWTSNKELSFSRSPLFWSFDTKTGEMIRESKIEEIVLEGPASVFPLNSGDNIIIRFGRIGNIRRGGYDSVSGWVNIENEVLDRIPFQGTERTVDFDDRLSFDWEYQLYGNFSVVPRPILTQHDVGVSLFNSRTGEYRVIPFEYNYLRNFANDDMTAVSHDRFRIAVVGMIAQRKDNDLMEYGWNVYVMNVIYDGSPLTNTNLYQLPDESSQIIGRLTPGTLLKVYEAANFTIDDQSRSDYWYLVQSEEFEGWVFGGDLLIEDEDWQGRLASRPAPQSIEQLITGLLAQSEENIEIEAPVVEAKEETEVLTLVTSHHTQRLNIFDAKFIIRLLIFSGVVLSLVFIVTRITKRLSMIDDGDSIQTHTETPEDQQ